MKAGGKTGAEAAGAEDIAKAEEIGVGLSEWKNKCVRSRRGFT